MSQTFRVIDLKNMKKKSYSLLKMKGKREIKNVRTINYRNFSFERVTALIAFFKN